MGYIFLTHPVYSSATRRSEGKQCSPNHYYDDSRIRWCWTYAIIPVMVQYSPFLISEWFNSQRYIEPHQSTIFGDCSLFLL